MSDKFFSHPVMKSINNYLAFALIGLSAIFFILFSVFSDGNWGGADSYVHYRIARYAVNYPHLFLDLWGKPVFNILSSPFAQFGFLGIKIFNVVVALLSSYLVYDIARMHNWHGRYVAILMLLFAPIYFIIIPSALTEPLFGLVLVGAVWLFFKDRFVLSAIVISLIPFARNEGFVLIPLFLVAYLMKRSYIAIPFLLTGFLFFSLVGWPVYDNFFWIFPQSQGGGDLGIYGRGPLFHYVHSIDKILGYPILIFWLIGFLFSFFSVLKRFKKITNEHYFFLLVVGGFLTYFAAHSVVRWLWEGRSLGLIRVIAGVVPLAALVGARGLHELLNFFWKKKLLSNVFITVSAILIVVHPFNKYPVPIPTSWEEQLIKISCNWLKEENLDDHLIYFYDPLIPHYLDKNPYDRQQVHELIDDRVNPENGIPTDAIIIWDAHFGPNEGQLPLDRLLHNEHFELLKKFVPEHPFKTLNAYDYEIYIFRRK
ncbi:hypothetical protein D1164_00130 [Mariniphaga sediminis]|jgi:ABC-type cobalt transport system substrate-binding protein|uniref:Glycosyltransferase RgtA/B/C/D-like domain-containing protein n=1 Tax=Mariniphaga sediminis TaxID=1628158 RepID=A0A399D9Z2_9BACT|nr:hypothetical protein [Mariniphaga sediminis]RIH66880.1 hypothetical protein D1164_00130 [Mariniphaga sediminis]